MYKYVSLGAQLELLIQATPFSMWPVLAWDSPHVAASFQEEASETEYSKRKAMEAARAFKPGLGGL